MAKHNLIFLFIFIFIILLFSNTLFAFSWCSGPCNYRQDCRIELVANQSNASIAVMHLKLDKIYERCGGIGKAKMSSIVVVFQNKTGTYPVQYNFTGFIDDAFIVFNSSYGKTGKQSKYFLYFGAEAARQNRSLKGAVRKAIGRPSITGYRREWVNHCFVLSPSCSVDGDIGTRCSLGHYGGTTAFINYAWPLPKNTSKTLIELWLGACLDDRVYIGFNKQTQAFRGSNNYQGYMSLSICNSSSCDIKASNQSSMSISDSKYNDCYSSIYEISYTREYINYNYTARLGKAEGEAKPKIEKRLYFFNLNNNESNNSFLMQISNPYNKTIWNINISSITACRLYPNQSNIAELKANNTAKLKISGRKQYLSQICSFPISHTFTYDNKTAKNVSLLRNFTAHFFAANISKTVYQLHNYPRPAKLNASTVYKLNIKSPFASEKTAIISEIDNVTKIECLNIDSCYYQSNREKVINGTVEKNNFTFSIPSAYRGAPAFIEAPFRVKTKSWPLSIFLKYNITKHSFCYSNRSCEITYNITLISKLPYLLTYFIHNDRELKGWSTDVLALKNVSILDSYRGIYSITNRSRASIGIRLLKGRANFSISMENESRYAFIDTEKKQANFSKHLLINNSENCSLENISLNFSYAALSLSRPLQVNMGKNSSKELTAFFNGSVNISINETKASKGFFGTSNRVFLISLPLRLKNTSISFTKGDWKDYVIYSSRAVNNSCPSNFFSWKAIESKEKEGRILVENQTVYNSCYLISYIRNERKTRSSSSGGSSFFWRKTLKSNTVNVSKENTSANTTVSYPITVKNVTESKANNPKQESVKTASRNMSETENNKVQLITKIVEIPASGIIETGTLKFTNPSLNCYYSLDNGPWLRAKTIKLEDGPHSLVVKCKYGNITLRKKFNFLSKSKMTARVIKAAAFDLKYLFLLLAIPLLYLLKKRFTTRSPF
ncbi:hypothetical protein DRN74_01270 [Candidatus Micrarchaeota archaeon]|nr:MAG: hypothetical protein DRN74_01270 [Candidatus Micrarchaeota archaeon]